MTLQGWEFMSGPFQDVEYLIRENQALFDTQIIPKGGPDPYRAAAERIIEHRHWQQSEQLIQPKIEPLLRELGVFYVPKQLAPGPCFCFPHTDVTGHRGKAKISPYGWQLVLKDGPAKYGLLGKKYAFRGPMWLGDSDLTLERILKSRLVVLVEGPFDLLACRLVHDLPVLTTGTKNLNEQHFAWLKTLGVDRISFLFDKEPKMYRPGAGEIAGDKMFDEALRWKLKPRHLACPAKDPSACLERYDDAMKLSRLLATAARSIF